MEVYKKYNNGLTGMDSVRWNRLRKYNYIHKSFLKTRHSQSSKLFVRSSNKCMGIE